MSNIDDKVKEFIKEWEDDAVYQWVSTYDNAETSRKEFRNDVVKLCQEVAQETRVEMVGELPKEKPMNVFSFHLEGQELEQYMRHKGWNECRAAMKDHLADGQTKLQNNEL